MRGRLLRLLYYGLPALDRRRLGAGPELGDLPEAAVGEATTTSRHTSGSFSTTRKGSAGRTPADAAHGLSEAWRRVRGRVRLTSTLEEVETFDLELAGLRGALETGDAGLARIARTGSWRSGRISVPEPESCSWTYLAAAGYVLSYDAICGGA